MATPEFISTLQATTLAGWIRGDESGSEWVFPIIETFHVFALAVVFGSIAMVDLRLLGITSRNSPVSKLEAEVLPWTWIAFTCAALTGSLLFLSKADTYYGNFEFRMKFLCMLLAGINMAVFHFGIGGRASVWDNTLPPPNGARVAGAVSLVLWAGVITFGRWIGFTT